jgi:hypothetical protein
MIKMKHYSLFVIAVMLSFSALAQGLKVQSGTNLVVSNSAKIVLSGNADLSNDGTFIHGNGEVVFAGDVDQEIKGSSTTSFYDLDVNKSAGELDASADFNVDNQLQMNSGQLDLQNSTVDLGTTGSIENETETNRIKVGNIVTNTGTIQATRSINNVTDYNPANLGVLISTDVNLGSITIVRGHQSLAGSGSFSANNSVARYYEVPNIGELDANDQVKMHYWQAELNGHTEANLEMYQWVEEGASSSWWTPLSGTVNTGTNLVSPAASPYSSYFDPPNWYAFNYTELFTLGSKDTPLPVELLGFDALCHGDFVSLEWETATEINNEKFIIERSLDGETFVQIGEVKGAGDSQQQLGYRFLDTDIQKRAYYRLMQVDFDGKYSYSNVVMTECTDISDPMFMVYPNPFKSDLHVVLGNLPEKEFVLELYTMEGKIIQNYEGYAPVEGFHKIMNLEDLPPAMYMIRLISGEFVKSVKITKQ